MKHLKYLLPLLFIGFLACNSSRTPRAPKREVPIAINIKAHNNATVNFVNLDYFRLELIQELDQFQSVNFLLVDAQDNPEVVLNMEISTFTLWPRDERISRRRVSRRIVAGTDAAGKPIYQTVTASIDIVQIQRRSNARFTTDLTIKGTPGLKFSRTFVPNYNYVNTYVENIQGDSRAVDPSITMRGPNIEPTENDFLLILAREEMVRRLSTELRKYYDAQVKALAPLDTSKRN
ncbi:hypothetical protein [Daejeonella sp. JGW-45]|uniref:hypothetical protein n=1 Tax=Daejeonella sp. JGW-45 TaxID=3034148 RepID=UPI0023EC710B|nr:hypothetical protein [Daejeonella sp. JGW-45]